MADSSNSATDDGENTINNLFSDLAPLLALFGERFAQQFLSESTSLWDGIVFACAPLGIITAIVGCIRVGGPPWLRAVIGRARENRAAAEIEFMSSTSNEVGESFNGKSIVRTLGKPQITQLIYVEEHNNGKECDANESNTFGIYTLQDTLDHGDISHNKSPFEEYSRTSVHAPRDKSETSLVRRVGARADQERPHSRDAEFWYNTGSVLLSRAADFLRGRKQSSIQDPENSIGLEQPSRENANSNESKELSPGTKPSQERSHHKDANAENYEAPNISLNIHGGSKKIDLILASLCGLLLQFGIVVFSGFTVYHPLFKSRFKKNGKDVAVYAYPTMAIGTVILFTGLLVCCIVIDRSTKESRWVLKSDDGSNGQPTAKKSKKKLRIFWLQKSHTTSDQEFDSFVLFAPDPTTEILTSRRLENERRNQPSRSRGISRTDSACGKQLKDTQESWFETLKRKNPGLPFLATFGTVLAVSGFILQFQGLRGLHWSSSIAQLVAVFFMTLIRAWVRRGLIQQPIAKRLIEQQYEMDWLALYMSTEGRYPESWPDLREETTEITEIRHIWQWMVDTGAYNQALPGNCEPPKLANIPDTNKCAYIPHQSVFDGSAAGKATQIRMRLFSLTGWSSPMADIANSVTIAIESVMNTIGAGVIKNTNPKNNFFWSLRARQEVIRASDVHFDKDSRLKFLLHLDSFNCSCYLKSETPDDRPSLPPSYITFKLEYSENGLWQADKSQIEAALSLWMLKLGPENRTSSKESIFLLGPGRESIKLDLDRWVGDLELIEGDFYRTDASPAESPSFYGFSGVLTEGEVANHSSPIYEAVAIKSEASLEVLLARHLFSAFMWAVSTKINPISDQGQTTVKNTDMFNVNEPNSIYALKLQNKKLSELAETIAQRTRLGNSKDILCLLIPPLSYANKLPMEALVDCIVQQARKLELLRRWKELVTVYDSLSKISAGLAKDTLKNKGSTLQKVIAIVFDELAYISHVINLRKEERRNDGIKDLEALKDRLDKQLEQLVGENNKGLLSKIFYGAGYKIPVMQEPLHRSPSYKVLDVHKYDSSTLWLAQWHLVLAHYDEEYDGPRDMGDLQRIDPGFLDLVGLSPLHHTIEIKNTVLWKHLQMGISIDVRGRGNMTPLHYAAMTGNLKWSQILLQAGANFELQDGSWKRPLHWAAFGGYTDVVALLVKKYGASTNVRDEYGRTPLHLAAIAKVSSSSYNTVRALLVTSTDEVLLSAADSDGINALSLSILANNIDTAEFILRKWGNIVEEQDKHGKVAIHYAAEKGCYTIFEPLSENRKNLHTQDSIGKTALHYAVEQGHLDIIKCLLNKSTDLEKTGRFALHHAAKRPHSFDIIKLILDFGIDVDTTNDNQETALFAAAVVPDNDCNIQVLLDNGADISRKNAEGRTIFDSAAAIAGNECTLAALICGMTALHEASSYIGTSVITPTLLTYDADTGALDKTGVAVLHCAMKTGNEATWKMLLDYGAGFDLSTCDESGKTPLQYIKENGKNESFFDLGLQWAISSRCKDTKTKAYFAAYLGRLDILNQIIDSNFDVNEPVLRDGSRLLHIAASNGFLNIVNRLIDVDIDIERLDNENRTPLHCAIQEGRSEIITRLLAAKCNVNAVDKNGLSALSYAVRLRDPKILDLILGSGVDVNAKLEDGGTVLHQAATMRHLDIVKKLLAAGADIQAVDNNGRTAHNVARSHHKHPIMGALAIKNSNLPQHYVPQDYR
ncbi:Similar to Ankyrin-3; acc. no. Q12955 [Pyronema omphalodes CBS 100304]|uniref:Similar to Ankyrin-3 acc. no. Q12955 n=1 Tax=Pyronema omphalodes (strain CBS 100304) TaxID=1076935 RepID=U4LH89_PYROM|nr:Similar to Ankyrin-3; acc. no. Q12955 [Pyronema omphalodes CBS 100304]